MSKSIVSSVSLPASIFEKSRMSLMIVRSASPESLIVSRQSCWSSLRCVPSKISDMPMMPFNGVRISWLIVARKSAFVFVAASASALAWIKMASPRLRSTTRPSCAPTYPMTCNNLASGSIVSVEKNSNTPTTCSPMIIGNPNPAFTPISFACWGLRKMGSWVTSRIQQGFPLANTRPGRPSPA